VELLMKIALSLGIMLAAVATFIPGYLLVPPF
jgi:hypothetical protein